MLAVQLDNAITACEATLARKGANFSTDCRTLGSLLQSMGWFREAIIWHSRSLEPQPKLTDLYASLAALRVKQRQWQCAIALYQQVLRFDVHHAEAHRSLAGIYAHLGQRNEEIAYRYRAVILNPNWATPSNQLILGNALIQMDKTEEAIDCYRRAIQLCPNFYEAHYNLAVAEISQQNWQGAKAAFQQALHLNPNHAESYYGLGKIAEQLEQFKAAAGYHWRAIQLNPEFAAAYFSLGEVLLKLRHWDKALPICYKATQLNPRLSWAYHNLGYALTKHQKWQAALIALIHAVKLNPDFPWTYYHLSQVLLQQQQWSKAAAVLLTALQIQTDLVAMYPRLGYALRRQAQGGLKKTILSYRQSKLIKPEHCTAEFYTQLGDQLLQAKQFTGAVILYSLGLLQQPDQVHLRAQIQQALTQQQQLDQEIDQHRQDIQQHPNYHWLYSHLGNVLADQGEWEEAIELHQNAVVMRGWQCAAHRNYEFTHDWFTHNVSTWDVHLKPFAHYPNVSALEIGSFEGMSACWLLDHVLTHPSAKLTCIDLFFQESFESNVLKTGAAQKLVRLSGDSHQILATLPPEHYDFIYVDGCHLAHHVQQDATLAWRLLKVGGLMVFDDYQWIDPSYPGQETYRGIDAFLDSTQHQLAVVHQGYQVIVRKLKSPVQKIAKNGKTMYPSNSNPLPPVVVRA